MSAEATKAMLKIASELTHGLDEVPLRSSHEVQALEAQAAVLQGACLALIADDLRELTAYVKKYLPIAANR